MKFALKSPDNLDLFRDAKGRAVLVEAREGLDTASLWPVDESVPEGRRWTGDWELVNGVSCKVTLEIPEPPEPTPEQIWQQKLAGRLTVGGIEIAASEAVRNLLTGQVTLLSIAISTGAMPADTPQDIWDADGVKHTMPASQLIALILGYGAAWQAMFAEFAP